jgi:hypothetical protein
MSPPSRPPRKAAAAERVRRALILALVMTALGAGAMGLRVLLQGEPFNPRTATLIGMAGLSAGLAGALLAPFVAGRRHWLWRLLIAGVFANLFMGFMTGLFVIEHVFIAQRYEFREGRALGEHVMNLLRTGGLFLASSPTYMLPWLLPFVSLAAGAVLPGNSHRSG